jgi:hypothetical protein
MKLNLKKTVLAAALTLVVAGQANAANIDMTGLSNTAAGNVAGSGSNLVLSIWDTVNQVSYTRDLGVSASSFFAGVTGTSTALIAGSGMASTTPFVADALLTSFLSGVNMASTKWNVTGGDSVGTGFMGQQYLSTTNVNIKSVANSLSSTQANSQLNAFGGLTGAQGYFTGANTAAGAAAMSVTASPSVNPLAYAGNTTFGTNWSAKSTFDTTAAVGSTLNFWYLTPSSTSTIAKASVAQFGNTAGASTWTLASNGNLTYTVAAVPEPGEWALMLSGFGLIGFIATRRRNMNSNIMNLA